MFPEEIKLFGRTWIAKLQSPQKDDVGECDDELQLMLVKPGLHPDMERSVLLHECIHAIEMSLGIGLTEKQVMGLEAGLYDLLASNPHLVSYLTKKNETI